MFFILSIEDYQCLISYICIQLMNPILYEELCTANARITIYILFFSIVELFFLFVHLSKCLYNRISILLKKKARTTCCNSRIWAGWLFSCHYQAHYVVPNHVAHTSVASVGIFYI